VRLAIILVVAGQLFLSPPHHRLIRASVEVSIFRAPDVYFTSLRTRRDGTFEQRLYPGDYIFRVRPTRKPYCYWTAVGVTGHVRNERVPVHIRVATGREHQCASSLP
jgi:hypothetical protein